MYITQCFCDKCKTKISHPSKRIYIEDCFTRYEKITDHWDVCEECYKEIKKFIKGK